MKVKELFEGTSLDQFDANSQWADIILERWEDDYPDVPLNSDLGVLLYRAKHDHFNEPTKQQQREFLTNVEKFKKQKLSREEAINLAFSTLHLTKK
jgi:hypothetical protein